MTRLVRLRLLMMSLEFDDRVGLPKARPWVRWLVIVSLLLACAGATVFLFT